MDSATKTVQNDYEMNTNRPNSTPKSMVWTGRVLSTLVVLFMVMDGVMKLVKPAPVIEATKRLGFPDAALMPIGIVLLISTIFYIFPRTAILGAILLTGYLGGAVATHVHAGSPTFETLFPVIFGVLAWGGLFLRDSRLRSIFPVRC